MKQLKLWEVINSTVNSQHRGSNNFSKNSTSNHLQELLSFILEKANLISSKLYYFTTFRPELP